MCHLGRALWFLRTYDRDDEGEWVKMMIFLCTGEGGQVRCYYNRIKKDERKVKKQVMVEI